MPQRLSEPPGRDVSAAGAAAAGAAAAGAAATGPAGAATGPAGAAVGSATAAGPAGAAVGSATAAVGAGAGSAAAVDPGAAVAAAGPGRPAIAPVDGVLAVLPGRCAVASRGVIAVVVGRRTSGPTGPGLAGEAGRPAAVVGADRGGRGRHRVQSGQVGPQFYQARGERVRCRRVTGEEVSGMVEPVTHVRDACGRRASLSASVVEIDGHPVEQGGDLCEQRAVVG